MSDEFAKGLGILTSGLFGWMVLSGWYTTEGFESTNQLVAEVPSDLAFYGNIAIILREVLFWFAVFGALTFWVLIPAGRQAYTAWTERQSSK